MFLVFAPRSKRASRIDSFSILFGGKNTFSRSNLDKAAGPTGLFQNSPTRAMLATDVDCAPRRLSLSSLAAEESNYHNLLEMPMITTPFGEEFSLPWTDGQTCHRQFLGMANNPFSTKSQAYSAIQDAVVLDNAASSWLDAFGDDLREASRLLGPLPGPVNVKIEEEVSAPT
eukprot:1283488-Rhodomonas_salina.9